MTSKSSLNFISAFYILAHICFKSSTASDLASTGFIIYCSVMLLFRQSPCRDEEGNKRRSSQKMCSVFFSPAVICVLFFLFNVILFFFSSLSDLFLVHNSVYSILP